MTESRKEKLLNMAEPMYRYIKSKKEKELTEAQLGQRFKLAGNEVRYVISKIVHKLQVPNLINIRDKVYIYTTNKSLLRLWWERKDKTYKPKYIQLAKIKKMIKVA